MRFLLPWVFAFIALLPDARAAELQSCLTDFIRPVSRLGFEMLTMQPTPECPKRMQIEKLNETALMLNAFGKILPIFGDFDPRGDDFSTKAHLLSVVVLRFDRAVDVPDLADLGRNKFYNYSVTDLPFDKRLSFNPPLRTHGFLIRDIEPNHNLICLATADDGTITLAIVCRTTTHEREVEQIGMLERMSKDVLSAIKF